MSLFGKILLVVNLLAAGGFVYLATQDWKGRQTITRRGLAASTRPRRLAPRRPARFPRRRARRHSAMRTPAAFRPRPSARSSSIATSRAWAAAATDPNTLAVSTAVPEPGRRGPARQGARSRRSWDATEGAEEAHSPQGLADLSGRDLRGAARSARLLAAPDRLDAESGKPRAKTEPRRWPRTRRTSSGS